MRLRTNGAAFGHSASMHAPPWHTKIMLGNSMLLRFTMRSSHLMHICSTSAHHCSANASSGPIEDDLARTCSMSGLIMARPMPLKELCVAHCSLPESFDASPPSSACHAQSSATCTSVVSHACSAAPAYLMLPESAPATSPPCPGRAKRWHHASIARCQPQNCQRVAMAQFSGRYCRLSKAGSHEPREGVLRDFRTGRAVRANVVIYVV